MGKRKKTTGTAGRRTKGKRRANPHFVVFYNGAEKCPERQELRLSAAYEVQEEEPELELRVQGYSLEEVKEKHLNMLISFRFYIGISCSVGA